MSPGGKRRGSSGGTRVADEVAALEELLRLYERFYTKSGIPRRLARKLWQQTVAWVRGGRRGKRGVLTRDQLRAALGITDTQEAAFKDAIDVLGENLRILGHPRASIGRREFDELRITRERRVHEESCTFVIGGARHLVYLLGPTGNDRGDRERNALWLEPIFDRLPEIAPVLMTPGFDELDFIGFNLSAVVAPQDTDGADVRALTAAKQAMVEAISAISFALHGAAGVFLPPDANRFLLGDIVEVEGSPVSAGDRGGGTGGAKIITETNAEGWLVSMFGGIAVILGVPQPIAARERLTAALDATAPQELDAISFDFRPQEQLALPPGELLLADTLLTLSYPIVAVTKNSATARIADGIELSANLRSFEQSWDLRLDFNRRTRSVNLWQSVRDFDTTTLLRTALKNLLP